MQRGTKQIRMGQVHRYMDTIKSEINKNNAIYHALKNSGNISEAAKYLIKVETLTEILSEMESLFPRN